MSSTFKTDLYQLTMLGGYFATGQHKKKAACEMFTRKLPANRNYLVTAGLEIVLDYLENLHFEDDQINYLLGLPQFKNLNTPEFRKYLENFRFTGDVWAMPEGTVSFQNEPFIRVESNLAEAQLVETFILSAINHSTMVASKAARVVTASAGRSVSEFGSRRTHHDAAVDAARAACIAGFTGTSNVEAGMKYGLNVLGTAAHMWTMVHGDEEEAFRNYVEVYGPNSTFLIDTYDIMKGVENAVNATNGALWAVRIDSGDLIKESSNVRAYLNSRGLRNVKIMATNDLNEHEIKKIVTARAPIDMFGVGTELVCSVDSPKLGGVYKLVSIEDENGVMRPTAKFSSNKATYPDAKQVYRTEHGDVLANANEICDGQPLLVKVMENGRRIHKESIATMQERTKRELAALPAVLLSNDASYVYSVRPSNYIDSMSAFLKAKNDTKFRKL